MVNNQRSNESGKRELKEDDGETQQIVYGYDGGNCQPRWRQQLTEAVAAIDRGGYRNRLWKSASVEELEVIDRVGDGSKRRPIEKRRNAVSNKLHRLYRKRRNVNSIVSAAVETVCHRENAASLFLLHRRNSPPLLYFAALPPSVKSCISQQVKKALDFHDDIISKEFQLNQVSYGILIDGLCKKGETRSALQFLRRIEELMVKQNMVMYSTVINSLCKDKIVDKAIELLAKIKDQGIQLDMYT
ncbi:pentatricopeptide repeat-containing protein At2g39230, mitochondrial-like [Trifolium pratense]|uniref:pentatricopeptide repeat-containing protein At2g39230, mitochondrial-like n=1 Tax=Trifolium pratense TaxID=57577 RepID=UPI001E695089|nr:pentatricopeptide repeat-containing protein At2g39230, mitochondrial-like [Trifolium pratense]